MKDKVEISKEHIPALSAFYNSKINELEPKIVELESQLVNFRRLLRELDETDGMEAPLAPHITHSNSKYDNTWSIKDKIKFVLSYHDKEMTAAEIVDYALEQGEEKDRRTFMQIVSLSLNSEAKKPNGLFIRRKVDGGNFINSLR